MMIALAVVYNNPFAGIIRYFQLSKLDYPNILPDPGQFGYSRLDCSIKSPVSLFVIRAQPNLGLIEEMNSLLLLHRFSRMGPTSASPSTAHGQDC